MIDVVASIQNAIVIVGKLRTLAKKVEDADLKMLLADLSNDLADAKIEVAELKERMANLIDENRNMRESLEQRAAVRPILLDGVYKFEDQEGGFCTACFDTKNQRVRVTPLVGHFRTFGKWECTACGATFS